MRAQDPDWLISKRGEVPDSWAIGVEPGTAWKKPGAWGTPFSCFRFAIPELCNFEGRAVYLDADMLVLGDVRELLEHKLVSGYHCIDPRRTDVSVIDCSFFKGKKWWPTIGFMKNSGAFTGIYVDHLMHFNASVATLPKTWNSCDPMQPCKDPGLDGLKLLHFTVVPTQPYRPYPTVTYRDHPWQSWVDRWNQELREAEASANSG